ncbi:MAG: alanine racemase [Eubacteriales bacterium]
MPDLWVEVNLDAVLHNYRQIKEKISPGSRCMAVVKADAYGMGAVEVAKILQDDGCEAFAVTTLDEAILLRQNGIDAIILVLGPTSRPSWGQAMEENIQITISDLERISDLEEFCREKNREFSIHIKVETGMGRTGVPEDQAEALVALLKKCSFVKPVGIYTHFARAAQKDNKYTSKQYSIFTNFVQKIENEGVSIKWKHVCNSAAFLDFPEYHHDFVRIGTLIIGHFPASSFAGQLDLEDPWIVKAKIIYLRKVCKGTYVGYQSLYKTKKDTELAVIPVGYADGFGIEPRFVPQGFIDLIKIYIKNALALFGIQLGRESLQVNGKRAQIAGKIGMQLTVFDVGDTPCKLGDEVVIPIRRTLANPRILRYYKKNGEFYIKRNVKEGFLSVNKEYSI